MPNSIRYFQSTLLLLFGLILSGGCQSMIQSTPQGTASTQEMVSVRIQPAYGKPRSTQIPLKENMRLQDVVDGVRVGFHNKSALIVRTSPSTGERHKLEAQFGSNRRISLQTDYAIQPGDRRRS